MVVKSDTKKAARDLRRRASGRFLLRLDPGVHAQLRAAAAAAGLSLNDYCARRLAAPASGATILGPATASVSRAAQLFGGELAAVLLFGSWARGEAGAASDVDLLVVLDPSIALTRELYRRWDEQSLDFEGRAVEVHFAHFPEVRDPPGALWAEAALDGVVLFERGLELSRFLVRVRREILSGRLMRRTAQGQPYWIEVA